MSSAPRSIGSTTRSFASRQWDRIEAVYLATQALHPSLTGSATAARIAPGEDFHVIQITRGWILDWYQVRRVGIVLEGKPIEEVIPQVTRVEYIATLRDYLLRPDWLRSVDDARDRCYAVLTFCRGLRSLETGDYVSKKDGAVWASATMPEFAPLIASASEWRLAKRVDRDDSTLRKLEVRELVEDLQQRIRSI